MRYRLMATYRGSPFEAGIGPTDDDIVLFAACPPPEEMGFEPATGHWRKQLHFADVQAVWESRPVGNFRGERCMVLDDLGDRLHIGYLGHDGYKATELGYWQVDRGVFELVAPRSEVSDIVEQRTEYAGPASRTDAPGPLDPSGRPESQLRREWPSSPVYPVERRPDSAAYTIPTSLTRPPAPASPVPAPQAAGYQDFGQGSGGEPAPYVTSPVPDSTTGVALPSPAEAPLPLEAQALRAASAARRPGQTAAKPRAGASSAPQRAAAAPAPPSSPRRPTRPRMATEQLFADLASLAGIPSDSYAVGREVDGAFCLMRTDDGFEVFHSSEGARHELQAFATEESACFYLFGLLAAEAVRNGTLARAPADRLA